MISRRAMLAASFTFLLASTALVIAQEREDSSNNSSLRTPGPSPQAANSPDQSSSASNSAHGAPAASTGTVHSSTLDARAMRIEGEKRFHANCGRCHVAPHKFPPRAMATIIRHMRVRATITDEDMKYILSYMTQ